MVEKIFKRKLILGMIAFFFLKRDYDEAICSLKKSLTIINYLIKISKIHDLFITEKRKRRNKIIRLIKKAKTKKIKYTESYNNNQKKSHKKSHKKTKWIKHTQ